MASLRPKFAPGLSSKLLLLTAAFVMIIEVLIFVPSVASFRRDWLMQRIVAAKIASLAMEAANGADLPERLRQELLMSAGVHAVSLRRSDVRKLVLGMPENHVISDVFDLRHPSYLELIGDSVYAFSHPPGRLVRVIAEPDMKPDQEIDIVIDETPLKTALWAYAGNLFWISLLISLTTAALVYFALNAILVRPMMRLTSAMMLYREDPEDFGRVIQPSGRTDEIGVAENELATLQRQLTEFLREKARLANIGLAVSKINHDLRNMLSNAQLVSDRLATVSDPTVQRFAPRLIRALDRAIALCVETLKYGRSHENPPNKSNFALKPLILEVSQSLCIEDNDIVDISVNIPPTLTIFADRDQIFRVFANLMRNAIEAVQFLGTSATKPMIDVTAFRDFGSVHIRVSDNGPGVHPKARPHLFKAFQSSSRAEGTGLGLVICAELVAAHGGEIRLEEDTATGAAFIIRVPDVTVTPGDDTHPDVPANPVQGAMERLHKTG